jgi:cardiolipin synthase
VCKVEEVGRGIDREIGPAVHLLAGYDEDVTSCDRIDGHDRHGFVVAMDESSRKFSVDDLCEDARHAATLVVVEMSGNRVLTIPNALTAARLACLPLYLWLLFEWNDRPLAALLLGFLGITDWVDGYVARRFDQRSDFGAVFDPVVDRLLFLVGTGAALVDGALPAWLAVLVLSREVLVGGAMAVATAFGMERFPVTTMGKRYTFLLMVGIPLLILSAGDHPTSELAGVVGWVCVVPGLVLSYVTGVLYVPKIRAALVSGRLKRGLP